MHRKQAIDFMIPVEEYPHIHYASTIREAIAVMEMAKISVADRQSLPRALLVFDNEYQLLGLLRRRDILRGLEPDFLTGKSQKQPGRLYDIKIDSNLAELSFETLIENMHDRIEQPVSTAMKTKVVTVEHDDHIMKVIYEMVENDATLLPVMKDGKVVGVVRSVDVFHQMAHFLLK